MNPTSNNGIVSGITKRKEKNLTTQQWKDSPIKTWSKFWMEFLHRRHPNSNKCMRTAQYH
jgi:hypothetical protein